MRRTRATALLLAAIALALAPACAGRPRKAPAPLEITFWAPLPAEVLGPVVAEFERRNPGVRVLVDGMPDSVRARRIAGARGDGLPDLCAVGTEDMPGLLAGGRLADWSAGVADLKPRMRGWESCTVGDALYGLPWLLAPRTLYVRTAVDGRAAPAFPGTWGELERAAGRIRRLGRAAFGYGVPTGADGLVDGVLPLIASAGGEVLSPDRRHAVFDSSAAVRAVELLVRLRRSGLLAPQDSLEREFAAGRLGMLLSGPGLSSRLQARGIPFSRGPVPHPDGDSVSVCWATGEVLVSFNASRHRHEALELARFLAGPGPAGRIAGEVGSFVAADDSVGGPDSSVRRDSCRYAPAHPAWPAMKDALADEIGRALRGAKPPARAVADAQSRLEEILGR